MASSSNDTQLVCMNKMTLLMSKILLARNLRRRYNGLSRKYHAGPGMEHLYGARNVYSRLFRERMLYQKMLLCWVQTHTFRRGLLKSQHLWYEENVKANFTDMQWLKHFKMCKSTFESLVNKLEQHLTSNPLAADKKIAVTLYALASSKTVEGVSVQFGISKRLVTLSIKEVCNAVINRFLPEAIKIPEEEVLIDCVEDFEKKWGFPQCVGVLGSIHVPVCMSKPPENETDYLNNDGGYSIYLQGIVDPSYKFWDINVGWPGSVQESRVLTSSQLWTQMQEKKLFSSMEKEINGESVPVCILANSSYPLTSWLIRPFVTTDNSPSDEVKFNKALKFAHSAAEIAFKRLKARWNCLATGNICSIEILPSVVATCCILHNLCEDAKETLLDKWVMKAESLYRQPLPSPCTTAFGPEAERVQKALKKYFCD